MFKILELVFFMGVWSEWYQISNIGCIISAISDWYCVVYHVSSASKSDAIYVISCNWLISKTVLFSDGFCYDSILDGHISLSILLMQTGGQLQWFKISESILVSADGSTLSDVSHRRNQDWYYWVSIAMRLKIQYDICDTNVYRLILEFRLIFETLGTTSISHANWGWPY